MKVVVTFEIASETGTEDQLYENLCLSIYEGEADADNWLQERITNIQLGYRKGYAIVCAPSCKEHVWTGV
jgi:hypothetical protein